MTEYKINLVNMLSDTKTFWCFLSKPESEISPNVYANSDTFLSVPEFTGSQKNAFTIPLQYSVQVGATNKAVGLNTLIESSDTHNTDLGIEWEATYTQEKGKRIGPSLAKTGTTPANQLAMVTNAYDKSAEKLNQWYGNMTYGVKSKNGFIGLTWSPDASTTYEILPKVTFYIATGSFIPNELADINKISTQSAVVTEKDFDGNNECTVTLNKEAKWVVTPGSPPEGINVLLPHLVEAHLNLTTSHSALIDMVSANPVVAQNTCGCTEAESLGITFDKLPKKAAVNGYITGTITILGAIGFGFAYMFASGVSLNVTNRETRDGKTEFSFSYKGELGAKAIENLFDKGSIVNFLG